VTRRLIAALAIVIVGTTAARAEVTRVTVSSRADIAFSGYEKITGRVFFALDPANPRNTVIADLDKAPRSADGRVEFSSDFTIIRPKSAGNGVAIVDIVNRGRPTVIPNFNRAGGRDPDVGDGFLLKRGFTVVTVGWEFDLPDTDDMIRIDVPVATDAGGPITGVVRASFTPDRADPFRVGDLAVYAPVDPADPNATLTVRDAMAGPAEMLLRTRWRLSGTTVSLEGGFEPGRIYEISFRASNPPIGGLGFAAVRDFAAWIRNDPSALTTASYVYAFGNSQSGRFLRTFLYQGFNEDERGRQVLDAVLANIAGAARLDLNRRWSIPVTASAPATEFPFADAALADPISNVVEGALENVRASRSRPKIFYTNTGVEYWSGSGRSAALIHTTPDGLADLTLPDNVRVYLFAGAQHSPGAFPPTQGAGQQVGNPLDYWWSLRALLVGMDRWVREGQTPPASTYPRLDRGTLVRSSSVSFPAIPGVQPPNALRPASRVPNLLVPGGAGGGVTLPYLVPQVDADGNETTGIRLPDVAVPLATYTGWNFRRPEIGGTHLTVSLLGSFVPLARTRAEREARRDPRLSIEERYPSRAAYVSRVRAVADALVGLRYLLPEDVDTVVKRSSDTWDLLTREASAPRAITAR
jgi:hypothetical protein